MQADYDIAAKVAAQIVNTLDANKDPKAILFGKVLFLCLSGLDESRLRQYLVRTSPSEN